MLVDYRTSADLYATLYKDLNIIGTMFLAFRDISHLIKEYVRGDKALDYGSGAGKSTLFLKSLGLKVEGVDTNDSMIKAAIDNDLLGKYVKVESGKIPSYDKNYDLVFASWVFMEVSSKAELKKIVKEIKRVLKINGILIIIVCNKEMYNNDWLSLNTSFEENRHIESGSIVKIEFKENNLSIYDYFWDEEDYKEIIINSDLDILSIHKPLGNNQDNYNWINEKEKAPYTIYIVKRTS